MLAGKDLGSSKRTVSTDDNQGINAEFLNVLIGFLPAFDCAELLAPCGLENGTSTLNGVAYTLSGEFFDVSTNKTFPTSVNAIYFPALIYRCSCDRPYAGVHARGVSARREHSNSLNFHNDDKYIIFSIICINVCAF